MDDPVSIALDGLGEDRGRRLFELLGAKAALREFRRVCAVRFAVHLLKAGEKDRAVIRDRLIGRYDMSRRNAYYCIDSALDEYVKVCNFDRRSCTQVANNASVQNDEQ